jgi:hypothetical protein
MRKRLRGAGSEVDQRRRSWPMMGKLGKSFGALSALQSARSLADCPDQTAGTVEGNFCRRGKGKINTAAPSRGARRFELDRLME